MGSQDQHRPPHDPDDEDAHPFPIRPPRTPLTPPESTCAFCSTAIDGGHTPGCPFRPRPT
ncbi:hypothetical protein [Streptomyces macrosporus]